MPIDPTPFMHHLARFDMSEAKKAELIESLEHMMECFLDWLENDEQAEEVLDKLRQADSGIPTDNVNLDQQPVMKLFERAARQEDEGCEESD